MLFGEIAVKRGFVNQQQLLEALQIQKSKSNWPIGEILAFLGYIEDRQIRHILKLQHSRSWSDKDSASEDGWPKLAQEDKNENTHILDFEDDFEDDIGQLIGRKFGRYRILQEIGRGGMGRVYKVYDTKLDRVAALKVLISGGSASSKEIERFLREARATAKLRHPNIVALHDIGNVEGQNYFTMDYLEGMSLKVFQQKYPLSIAQIVKIIIKVGQALHYAHTREIIHRDIKPSNIMVDIYLEPKVMDFGLAKMISVNDNLSKTGDILGTPAYMSPEQSESKTIDNRSDVYSLGATLYEALIGKTPFQGESYVDILYQIVHKEPIPLRKINSAIPSELEAICLKSLEKKPQKRYQSALLLVKDLQNFLDNKPIIARPPSKWRHLRKILFSHRALIFLALLITIIILIGGAFSFFQWQKARIEKNSIQNTLLRSQNRHKLILADIALSKSKESYQQHNWTHCALFAGYSLELIRGDRCAQAKDIRNQSIVLMKTALKNSKSTMLENPDSKLFASPLMVMERHFRLKVKKNLEVIPLDSSK